MSILLCCIFVFNIRAHIDYALSYSEIVFSADSKTSPFLLPDAAKRISKELANRNIN